MLRQMLLRGQEARIFSTASRDSNPASRSPALRLASGKASKTVPKDGLCRIASHQPARFSLRAHIHTPWRIKLTRTLHATRQSPKPHNCFITNFAWEDDYPDIPGPEFNDWFPYFIGMDDGGRRGAWNSADGFNHLQLKVKGKGEEFLREVTKKFNTDWKMIDQNKMATEVASIMVEGPLKVTPQSAISKLMLNPTKFNVNGIDKAEWGKFVKKPFTHDREWMRGLEKQFKKYIG